MNDKIVTHADLPTLREVYRTLGPECGSAADALLTHLIAAAEADAPPLPEGWVVYADTDGDQTVYWHDGGRLYLWSNGSQGEVDNYARLVDGNRNRLAPLRPTVTEADVEKAAKAAYEDQRDYPAAWEKCPYPQRDRNLDSIIRKAFAAAGVEVQS